MKNWKSRLTEAREARGLSKADLSRATKISTATTSNWETGGKISSLNADSLMLICDALSISPTWLWCGKGEMCRPTISTDGVSEERAAPYLPITRRIIRLLETAPLDLQKIILALLERENVGR